MRAPVNITPIHSKHIEQHIPPQTANRPARIAAASVFRRGLFLDLNFVAVQRALERRVHDDMPARILVYAVVGVVRRAFPRPIRSRSRL